MKAEFHPPDDPEKIVATAVWAGSAATVDTANEELGDKLRRAFRSTPVVVDDASRRAQGTSGAIVTTPGTLEWFRAVCQVRVPAETGLAARLIPGVTEGGFDPAAGYRTFDDSIERLTS